MAIGFRASSTDTGASGTLTPTEPTGSNEDDIILAHVAIASVDGSWTAPADFTQLDTNIATGGPDTHHWVGYKVRGATAGNGYTFTYTGTAASGAAQLVGYSGGKITEPLDVTYSNALHFNESALSTGNEAAQPITTVTDNAMVVLLFMSNESITTFGPPTDYNQRSAATATLSPYACDKLTTTAGTQTPGVFTHTVTTQENRTYVVAIRDSAATIAASKLAVLKRNRHF